MTPELIIAIGTASAALAGAVMGGQHGGKNALNGFKKEVQDDFIEVKESFKGINEKLDGLMKTDGAHDERLKQIERLVDRRQESSPVFEERRQG